MTHFLPITRVAEHSYTLRVTEELCVGPLGHVFLFGGAGLGAAVFGRPGQAEAPGNLRRRLHAIDRLMVRRRRRM